MTNDEAKAALIDLNIYLQNLELDVLGKLEPKTVLSAIKALTLLASDDHVWAPKKDVKPYGFNHCIYVAAEACEFLAENPRPSYGNDRFNSAHLHQLHRELWIEIQARLAAPPIGE